MSDELEFKEWWSEFRHEHRNDKDFTHELSCLKSEVGSFSQVKREALIDELLNLGGFETYACELIAKFGSDDQIQLIKTKAQSLIKQESTDNILNDYITLIIKTYQEQDILILRKYFIDYQKKQFIRVRGELFEIDRDLFLQAFSINLENYPIDKLCDYDGLLYMTNHLDALEFLIKNLPFTLSEKLKVFTLAKANHSYSDFDKKLKIRLIELSDLKKSEIELIKQNRLKTINERQPPINDIKNVG
jgi:hypothetical protein